MLACHKIYLTASYIPETSNKDESLKKRIKIIPFISKFTKNIIEKKECQQMCM